MLFVGSVAAMVNPVALGGGRNAAVVRAAHLAGAASSIAAVRFVAAVRAVGEPVAEPRRDYALAVRARKLFCWTCCRKLN